MIKSFCLTLIFLLGLPLVGSSQTNISEEVSQLIDKYLPQSSEVGIAVYNLTTNQWVYKHQGHKLSRPASTMKLITAIAALTYDAEPFETSLWYKGEIKDETLHGDLYIIGGLDPEFGNTKMDQLVTAVSAQGIKEIKGNIYGDISLKDSLYWGTEWGWDDNPNSYQPYISPLMYNKGKVSVIAKPQAQGHKAKLILTPETSYYTLTNQTQSKNPSAGKFKVTRKWLENKNDIIVKGNVDRYRVQEINMQNSGHYFLHVFCEKLSDNYITINGGYQTTESTPTDAELICTINTPIEEVLTALLKDSDNLNGEAILVALAKRDKRKHIHAQDGVKYIEQLVTLIGDDPSKYRFADGCGLSSYNLISANLLVELLKYSYRDNEIYDKILPALPVSGIDGTLAYRMKSTPAFRKIKAKTGTINAISTLAGYAENSKGEILAFAILNQNIIKSIHARRFQDALCSLLCR